MRKIKLLAMALIVGLFAVSLVSCTDNRSLKSIYDNSERIAAQGDSYSFANRNGNANDEKIEVEFGKFSGCETILRIKSETKGEISFDFESDVVKGRLKAVIITPDDAMMNMFANDDNQKEQQGVYTLNMQPGVYRVKIVGDAASGEFKIETKLDKKMRILK